MVEVEQPRGRAIVQPDRPRRRFAGHRWCKIRIIHFDQIFDTVNSQANCLAAEIHQNCGIGHGPVGFAENPATIHHGDQGSPHVRDAKHRRRRAGQRGERERREHLAQPLDRRRASCRAGAPQQQSQA